MGHHAAGGHLGVALGLEELNECSTHPVTCSQQDHLVTCQQDQFVTCQQDHSITCQQDQFVTCQQDHLVTCQQDHLVTCQPRGGQSRTKD